MTLGTATAVQLSFGLICTIAGVIGTWLQVAGQRFTHRGGPREAPVLARLGGRGSPWNQLIFIEDRGAVAAFGAMLGNAGSAMLMASVIAGLVINFPGIWPIGAAVYVSVLGFGAGRIVWLGTADLWRTRIIQEDMFEKLPPDGTDENAGYDSRLAPGRVVVQTAYRTDILKIKPDLACRISATWSLARPFVLYRFVFSALRREDVSRSHAYDEAKNRMCHP